MEVDVSVVYIYMTYCATKSYTLLCTIIAA